MPYTLTISLHPFTCVLLGGLLGGALNAALSNNLHLLPSRTVDLRWNGRRVARMGLLLNCAIGAGVAALVHVSIEGVTQPTLVTPLPILLVFSTLHGLLVARVLGSEVDKRLLRHALKNAISSPAAHPDMARAIDRATPYDVYRLALELVPRRLMTSPSRALPVGPSADSAPHV